MPSVLQQALLSSTSAVALIPVTYTYHGHTTSTWSGAGLLYNAAGVPIGPALAGRVVFCAVHFLSSSGLGTLTSASIGGVPADIHCQFSTISGSTYNPNVAIISATVPTGTTATVTTDFGGAGSTAFVYIASYSVYNLSSLTPIDTVAANASAATFSDTIDEKSGGFSIFAGTTYGANAAVTVVGMTEDYETALGAVNTRDFGSALVPTADELNRVISATRTGGSGTSSNFACAAASFR
ncbi:hypothetical protein [Mesorhizobium sp. LSJC255A00]|uniref:hypothetical protein n=1 Tax=Mesorhizobium sp. LSJC255A00 TaxID=1287313 RepID=UPI0012EB7099|nr:hypothetical protein [Mesorhizobium sp. LSJC255A00]